MKKYICFILLYLLFNNSYAQGLFNYVACPTFENQTGQDNSCFWSNSLGGLCSDDNSTSNQMEFTYPKQGTQLLDLNLPFLNLTTNGGGDPLEPHVFIDLAEQHLQSGNHRVGALMRTCLSDGGTAVSSTKGKISMGLVGALVPLGHYVFTVKVVRFYGAATTRSPDMAVFLGKNSGDTNKDYQIAHYEIHDNGGPNHDQFFTYTINFDCPDEGDLDWLTFEVDNDCIDIGQLLNASYYAGYFIDDVGIFEKCNYQNNNYQCSITGGAGLNLFAIGTTTHDQNSPFHLMVGPEVMYVRVDVRPISGQHIDFFEQACINGYPFNLYWDGQSAGHAEFSQGWYIADIVIANSCIFRNFSISFFKSNSTGFPTIVPAPMASACTFCAFPIPRYAACCLNDLSLSNTFLLCPPPYPVDYTVSGNITVGPNLVLGPDVQLDLSAGNNITLANPLYMGAGAEIHPTVGNLCRVGQLNSYFPVDTLPCPIDSIKLTAPNPDSTRYNIFWILPDQTIIHSNDLSYYPIDPGLIQIFIGLVDTTTGDTTLISKEFYRPDCGNQRLISNLPKLQEITLFPIPANGTLTINSGKENIQEIRITDILGNEKNIYSDVNSMQKEINTTFYSPGIYAIFIKTENKVFSRKFSIIR